MVSCLDSETRSPPSGIRANKNGCFSIDRDTQYVFILFGIVMEFTQLIEN